MAVVALATVREAQANVVNVVGLRLLPSGLRELEQRRGAQTPPARP